MIQYITKGSDFVGAARYVARKDGAERVGGNLSSPTPRGMAAEWSMWTELNDQIEKDVFHVSLSLPAGEELEAEQWREACETYLERMGFGQSAWVAYRHGDTRHDHVHILANRVDFEGKAVNVWRDHIRGQEVCRELERDFALERVPSGRDQLREEELAESLQDRVQAAAWASDEMGEFVRELERRRVDLEVRRREDGTPYGISYGRRGDDEMVAGSDIGRAFSWSGLQKRANIEWDRQRDDRVLRRAERELEARKTAKKEPLEIVQRGLSKASPVKAEPPEPEEPSVERVIERPSPPPQAERNEPEIGFEQAETLEYRSQQDVDRERWEREQAAWRMWRDEQDHRTQQDVDRERFERMERDYQMQLAREAEEARHERQYQHWQARKQREELKAHAIEHGEMNEGFTYAPDERLEGRMSNVRHFEDGVSMAVVASHRNNTFVVVELPEAKARQLEEHHEDRLIEVDPRGERVSVELAYGKKRDRDRGDDFDMER